MIGRTQNGLVLVEMDETYIKVEPVTEMKGVETEVKVLTVQAVAVVVELVAVETVPEEKEGKFMHIVFLPDMHVQEDLEEVQTEKRWHYLPITQICLCQDTSKGCAVLYRFDNN